MEDKSTTEFELIQENSLLKQRIKELEQSGTDVKQAKEAVRESESMFRAIAENGSTVFFCFSR
jgi:hypothetical protein